MIVSQIVYDTRYGSDGNCSEQSQSSWKDQRNVIAKEQALSDIISTTLGHTAGKIIAVHLA